MGPEVRHLRYFVAVAEELSFTRAARRLFMAQQPLSAAIRQLERVLGVALFARTTRSVSLTEAGAALLPEAYEVLTLMERLTSRAGEQARPAALRPARLRVGLWAEAAGQLLAPILAAFRRRRPDVVVDLSDVPWVPVGALVDGRVDVVFTCGPYDDERLEQHVLFTQRRAALVPEHHPLRDAGSVTVRELLDAELPAGRRHPFEPAGWDRFYNLLEERGGEPPRRLASPAVGRGPEAVWLAVHGATFTLNLAAAAALAPVGLHFVDVPELAPDPVALTTLRGNPAPELAAFLATAQEVAQDLAPLLPGAGPATGP